MAASEFQMAPNVDGSLCGDREERSSDSGRKRGGWITFPFIIGGLTGLTVAGGGWFSNLIVYLIEEFNIKSIDAAQIFNVVSGCICLFPIIGAIIADSFLGTFAVILVSSCISLLGILLLFLTASLDLLRPRPCESESSFCQSPSKLQFTILYTGTALASMGLGGSRFTIATMGANQLEKPHDQAVFFNWYIFSLYTSFVVSATAIVYIEDNISWRLGLGLSIAANLVGLAIFLLGKHFYQHEKPQGSPFMGLARVIVAAIRKRKIPLTSKREDYCHDSDMVASLPNKSFRFLNRAAVRTEGDMDEDRSITKPWRLCTVQEVEDFKTLIKIFPLWSTGIFLSTPIAIQSSLTILQALTMDRHLGPNFRIPSGSFIVIILISTCVFLPLIDRFICPMWQKLTHQSPKPLQRIGLGHVFNVLSMAVSGLVEYKRLKIAHDHQTMSALWLFPQLILVGTGEALHFPGQVALYYQEFPMSLKSTSTAMVAMFTAIAYYLSAALIDFVRRVTTWLPDDINDGRLDNVYWTLTVLGLLNFGYFLICSRLYKYQNVEKGADGGSVSF